MARPNMRKLPPRFSVARMVRISKRQRWNYEVPAWGVDRRVWIMRPEVARLMLRAMEKSPDRDGPLPSGLARMVCLRGVKIHRAPFATRPMRGILRPGAAVAREEVQEREEEDDMLAMIRTVTGKARPSARAWARRQMFKVPDPRPFGYGRGL